jgi:hypothetical protein
MQKPSILRYIGISIIATLMTTLFVFLGAPFLRVIRNVFGPLKYWLAGIIAAGLFWGIQMQPLGLLTLAVWLVVGIYSEAEERGYASLWIAAGSILVSSAFFIGGMMAWSSGTGISLEQLMDQGVKALLSQLGNGTDSLKAIQVDPKVVLQQTPSAIVLLMLTSLAFALMFDRRTGAMTGLRFERISTHMRLLEFKLPDFFIWITMFSFLLSFIKLESAWIGIVGSNVFNVMMGFYFFQGLAVLEVSFLVFRIGSFIKFLVYFFIVGQLFLLLSAVGVIDYWIDFRARMRRLRRPERNQNNGEHV